MTTSHKINYEQVFDKVGQHMQQKNKKLIECEIKYYNHLIMNKF